jgi:hypothetical protein
VLRLRCFSRRPRWYLFASTVPHAKTVHDYFATAIALSGMYKFRAELAGQIYAQRYFYFGCVFSIWFLCCLGSGFAAVACDPGNLRRDPFISGDKKYVANNGRLAMGSVGEPHLQRASRNHAKFTGRISHCHAGLASRPAEGSLTLLGHEFTQLSAYPMIEPRGGWRIQS